MLRIADGRRKALWIGPMRPLAPAALLPLLVVLAFVSRATAEPVLPEATLVWWRADTRPLLGEEPTVEGTAGVRQAVSRLLALLGDRAAPGAPGIADFAGWALATGRPHTGSVVNRPADAAPLLAVELAVPAGAFDSLVAAAAEGLGGLSAEELRVAGIGPARRLGTGLVMGMVGERAIVAATEADLRAFVSEGPFAGHPAGVIAAGEWGAHVAAARAPLDEGVTVLEAFININALRHELDPAFSGGAGDRLLHAWGLSNARGMGLHARIVPPAAVGTRDPELPRLGADAPYAGPPMLRVDLTVSARSRPPGEIERRPLTGGYWPAAQSAWPPPRMAWVAAVRAPWGLALESALSTRVAALEPLDGDRFAAAARSWSAEHRSRLAELAGSLSPWFVWGPVEAGRLDRWAWRVEFRPDTDVGAVREAFTAVTAPLAGRREEIGGGSWGYSVGGGPARAGVAWRLEPRPARGGIVGVLVLGGPPTREALDAAAARVKPAD